MSLPGDRGRDDSIEGCAKPREQQQLDTAAEEAATSGVTGQCVIICGRCLERGPQYERMSNASGPSLQPRLLGNQEPELRKAMEEQGRPGVATASVDC